MITNRTSALPPLYTHPIGSLPRPAAVRDLLAARGALPADRFRGLLDDAVRMAIDMQELAGLDVVSDGEWRRVQYIREFLLRIGGFERCRRYEHQGEIKLTEVVVRRMPDAGPVFAADGRFLVENARRVTKFALPSPFLIAMRYWHADHSREAYATWRHFAEHLAEVLAREAAALVAAGVDIIQIDDPALTYFCDPSLLRGETHDERLRRAWNPDVDVPFAVEAINRVVEGLPAETHVHCCHSVYKRRSDVQGDYQPLLPRLAGLKVDRLNLEFAYQTTGRPDDLAFLPHHLRLGMGVLDVRGERLQSTDEIAALAAAGIAAIGSHRIALNPDCGFAPDAGEPPTIDEAYEKLKRLAAAAAELRRRQDGGPALPPVLP
jgi:5-methyltetrahydropteroyltriglutamate--homocysteine methyltransferase